MSEVTKEESREIAVGLGRAMFLADYRADNPDATQDMRQAAWMAKKPEYLGKARQVMARLESQDLELKLTKSK